MVLKIKNMNFNIYIIRHGRTRENYRGIITGVLPGTLDKVGKKQAERLGKYLATKDITKIFSSDLQRAVETTNIINSIFEKPAEVIYSELLREVDFGDYTGKKISEVDWNNLPKNYENFSQTLKRAQEFFTILKNKINSRNFEGNILIVTHHIFINAIANIIGGLENEEMMEQENNSINIITLNEHFHTICHKKLNK